MPGDTVVQTRSDLGQRAVSSIRDPGLWIALLASLSMRLLILLLWITTWKRKPWVGHLKYDLSIWRDFFAQVRAGEIPYVDFPREYPVLTSSIYWLMAFFVRPKSEQSAILVHASVMLIADLINVWLFYRLAREANARWALAGTLVFSLNLTALVLGPVRFESILVTTLLLGYALHLRGRHASAAALWSLGAAIKWYPAFLFVAQQWKLWTLGRLRFRWWTPVLAFVAVQLALNVPFLLGAWLKHGNVDAWLKTYTYHMDRPLSVDTLRGIAQLWFGPVAWERYASHATLLLICVAMFVRPRLSLARTAVLVGIAVVVFNRVYSPQFNLWFYPFLLLWMLSVPPERMAWVFGLFVALEVTNVLAYPFAFTDALEEMGTFDGAAAAASGGSGTVVWSLAIVVRSLLLIAIAVEVLRQREPSTELAPAAREFGAATSPDA